MVTRRFAVSAGMVVTIALVGCGSPSDNDRVEAYCAYGSKSEAQYRGCVEHVTIERVNAANTAAGRYARGDGSDCPKTTYCEAWLEGRSYDGPYDDGSYETPNDGGESSYGGGGFGSGDQGSGSYGAGGGGF